MGNVLQVQCNSLCSLSAGAVAVLWLAALLQLLPGEFHQALQVIFHFCCIVLQLVLAPLAALQLLLCPGAQVRANRHNYVHAIVALPSDLSQVSILGY